MRGWLYSKRPSENIETKCKSTRKAEHRGKELTDKMKDIGRRKGRR